MENVPVLPAQVSVGPYTLEVRLDKLSTEVAHAWAYINWREQVLVLDPDTTIERQQVALLHEVLHGVWEATNADLFEGDQEATVTIIAPVLIDTFNRNPDLMAFLSWQPDDGEAE